MFKVNNKDTETTSIKFIANNESEQIMKQIHHIHACLIIFLIHYCDTIHLLKSDKIHQILIQ